MLRTLSLTLLIGMLCQTSACSLISTPEKEQAKGQIKPLHEQKNCDSIAILEMVRPAAEQGNAFAQFQLGKMYLDGMGVAQNEAEAFKWLQKAARQGEKNATLLLNKILRSSQ